MTEPQFHVWFTQYQAMNMKKNMIKPVRQAVGLGNIPMEFTNNPANARIKSKVNYKKSELNIFCAEMRELVDSQARHIERAFTLDTGPYEVSPPYHRYKENPRKWVKESKSYRESLRVLRQIHNLKLIPQTLSSKSTDEDVDSTSDSSVSNGDKENSLSSANVSPLSISWKEVGLAEEIFGGMWAKAASLAADNDTITNAPGLSNSKVVVSYITPKKPHLVTMFTSGKVTCDCLNYCAKSLSPTSCKPIYPQPTITTPLLSHKNGVLPRLSAATDYDIIITLEYHKDGVQI